MPKRRWLGLTTTKYIWLIQSNLRYESTDMTEMLHCWVSPWQQARSTTFDCSFLSLIISSLIQYYVVMRAGSWCSTLYELLLWARMTLWLWRCMYIFHYIDVNWSLTNTADFRLHCSSQNLIRQAQIYASNSRSRSLTLWNCYKKMHEISSYAV